MCVVMVCLDLPSIVGVFPSKHIFELIVYIKPLETAEAQFDLFGELLFESFQTFPKQSSAVGFLAACCTAGLCVRRSRAG